MKVQQKIHKSINWSFQKINCWLKQYVHPNVFVRKISKIFKLIQMVEIVQNHISRQYLLISRHIYQTGTATVTSARRATWAWSWMWPSAPSSVQKIHDTVLRRTATLPTTQMRERYYARQGEQFWFLSKMENIV